MKVTTERLADCQVQITIELDAADVDKKLRQTARKISRQFSVPGYRRGKAPYHAVIRVFGREAVQQEALEEFGNDLYEQALEEIEYEAYEIGKLEEVEWDPFRMTVLLPIPPEVDLGDYRAVRVPFEIETVSDEDVTEYLATLQEEHAQWVPVERPAALGDQVVLDMVAQVDDQEVMNNQEYEMLLEAGASTPVSGFHEQIVDLSPGEEKTFTLTFPEDDADEIAAGQQGTFTVYLHTLKEKDVPPLDDDLALMIGDYDTLADLQASIREQLETKARQKTKAEYLDKALDAFIEAAARIEYPPQAIDREAELALDQIERNLSASGLQLDAYLGMIGKTREVYKQELGPAAEKRLQKRLVLDEIAEREALTVDEDEIEAELERMREMMGPAAEQMMATLDSPNGRLIIANDLRTGIAEEWAVAIAKGETPPLAEAQEETDEPETSPELEAQEETGEPETSPEPEAQEETDEPETSPEPEAQEETGEPETSSEPEAEG
jgi:trigger factor